MTVKYEFHKLGDALLGLGRRVVERRDEKQEKRCKIELRGFGIEVRFKGEKNQPIDEVLETAVQKFVQRKQQLATLAISSH